MVLEGVILSLCAGAVALLLTSWTAKTFAWFIPPNSNPIVLNGTVDHNVVIGIVVLALLASMLCGAFPAWRSSHVPAAEVLKEESASISGGSRNRHLLSGLVVAQIALSLALLVSSGLFLQTLRNLSDANPGFEQDHVLTASVGLNIAGYSDERGAGDPSQDSRSRGCIARRNGCIAHGLGSDELHAQDGRCLPGRVCAPPARVAGGAQGRCDAAVFRNPWHSDDRGARFHAGRQRKSAARLDRGRDGRTPLLAGAGSAGQEALVFGVTPFWLWAW